LSFDFFFCCHFGFEVGVGRFDLRAAVFESGLAVLDPRFELFLAFLKVEQVLFTLLDCFELFVDVSLVRLQAFDLGFDFGRVDGAREDFVEVVVPCNGAPGFVLLEEEREQVRDFRVFQESVAAGRDAVVLSVESPFDRGLFQVEFDTSRFCVPFERELVAPHRRHHYLEKRRAVGGVGALKDRDARFEFDCGLRDASDVLHIKRDGVVKLLGCSHAWKGILHRDNSSPFSGVALS